MNGSRTIRRIAIANRGEAALRCIRAVKSMRALDGSSLEVVALYTDADGDAPFVRHADNAILLDSSRGAVAAYLDHEGLVRAIEEAGADAVWPGWGFVAEDPEFVAKLGERGIAFLGPSPEAMRAVGDKIASKDLAETADVPVTAWSGGALADAAETERHAERIGYPLVIKASAGGGGRGIRVVHERDEVAAAFTSAGSEAETAFGDGRLFCEAMVVGGRHIEVQIAADMHGDVLALGCRDCSVQRRHQKVLEEAPPPGLPNELRNRIEAAAVRLARAVDYEGVGTVEFLVEGDQFYFLEVNPRLQVEHGITEEITGLDLVQLQIRIAQGESIKTVVVREQGVAIEARLCAEDPDANFLPAPGRIALFEPSLGPRIRIDSGVGAGSTVPPDFDSLIAKVIANGDTREEALARLRATLRDFEIVVEGGATTKGYLLEVLDDPEYCAGPVDTRWLDRWNEAREGRAPADPKVSLDALVAACIIGYRRRRRQAREHFYADTTAISAARVPPCEGQQLDVSFGGEGYRVKVYAVGNWRYRIHMEGRVVGAMMREEGAHAARLLIDDRVRRILYDDNEQGLRLEVDGEPRRFGWQTAGQVTAGSPAMVVSIDVSEGDRVEAGQLLGFIEAMKTEIGFHAPVSGVVTEVAAHRGQQVAAGEVLLVIDPSTDEGDESQAGARLELPVQRDPLALLFQPSGDDPLAIPDLGDADEAGRADPAIRGQAIQAVREEIRRLLLGFDVNAERSESLVGFLEAPLPDGLSRTFLAELAEVRDELATFVDIERLSIRAPRASVSGELGPSNNARFRTYIRRFREEGAGLPDEFLDLVRAALAHYGVPSLEPDDRLERATLRLLSTQFGSDVRIDLVLGVIHRVTNLAKAGIDMTRDARLRHALEDIASMRGLLSDTVADAALEAVYVIFEKPDIDRAAEQSSRDLERWLAESQFRPTAPSGKVLIEVAAAARRVFDRVGRWIVAPDPGRREIALAAHVQRIYAPRIPLGHASLKVEGTWVHCVDYPGLGLVLAATAAEDPIPMVARRLCQAVERITVREGGDRVYGVELLVPDSVEVDEERLVRELAPTLSTNGLGCPMTVAFMSTDGEHEYKTFAKVSGGFVLRRELYDLHPEAASRIHLNRLSNFDLERIPCEEGVYAFYGRAREVRGDERIFVLADARERRPQEDVDVALHLPAFERVFHRCTRTLRTILRLRDPRRRLQWNRIVIFVASPVVLDRKMTGIIAKRLAPATRHLGLEKVLVTLNLLDPEAPDEPARATEVIINETGPQMEISWRGPHLDPLRPVELYERRVVAARRRRLIYPYEIIKMLSSGEGVAADPGADDVQTLPAGSFEEFDLDDEVLYPLAKSVEGRPPGQNSAAIVFGIVTTPTDKVPEGMQRVLILSDPTMGMGALSGEECDRIVAALDLAEERQLPVEWLPVSSGAKIAMDSGTENLDATARVVRRIVTFTQDGGTIHLIVQGVNVGAQSYFDALATMLTHTRGVLIMTPRASMVLTGRLALEYSGAVAAEDEVAIGGFERIMGPNGEAQYYARNLVEAYRILYDYYRYSYVVPGEKGPRCLQTDDAAGRSVCEHAITDAEEGSFQRVGEIFDDTTNPGRKKPFAMREVMASLIDRDGGHLERWYSMMAGETAIVWDAHLGGMPISLIGIESQSVPREGYRPHDGPESWTGGTLFPYSSKKVARAINVASGNRPVVVLANLSGFDGSPESLRNLQLEYGAEIARAVVNFEGPLLFLVVSRYHGGAYVVFSQELNDGLSASALTGSYASVIGGGPAAAVVFSREVRAQALADPRVTAVQRNVRGQSKAEAREAFDAVFKQVKLEKQAEIADEFDRVHSVERARQVGSLSRIIDPQRMRADLITELEAALAPSEDDL